MSFPDFNDLSYLEPGYDDNPLDRPVAYNPYHHAYDIVVQSAVGKLDVTIEFALLDASNYDTVEFDVGDKHFSVPLFPLIENGLEPLEGKITDIHYQIGEVPYVVVPQVVRVLADGQHLSAAQAEQLITPAALYEGIIVYRNKVRFDPRAPKALYNVLCDVIGNTGDGYSLASDDEDNDEDSGWDD